MNHAMNGRHFYDSATRPTYRRAKYIRDKSNLVNYTCLFSFFISSYKIRSRYF